MNKKLNKKSKKLNKKSKKQYTFLKIYNIPRQYIEKEYYNTEKETTSLLISHPELMIEFWVSSKSVFINEYALTFTLSLAAELSYSITNLESLEEYDLSGDELYEQFSNLFEDEEDEEDEEDKEDKKVVLKKKK